MTVYDDERVTCVSERVSAETGRAGASVNTHGVSQLARRSTSLFTTTYRRSPSSSRIKE